MDLHLLNGLSDLQNLIRDIGLGGTTISIPESKVLSEDQVHSDKNPVFSQYVTNKAIMAVAKDLFNSGFFAQAVEESFKVLEARVRELLGEDVKPTEEVIRLAFSPDEPRLVWSDRSTKSESDEQIGYFQLYMGSFIGIRNPIRGESGWRVEQGFALDAIVLAQHLLTKLENARLNSRPGPAVI